MLTVGLAGCSDGERISIALTTLATTTTTTTATTPATVPAPPTIDDLKQSAVRVFLTDEDGRQVASGSGTIVDPSGLILTNAHVATLNADGLAVLYRPSDPIDVDRILVGLIEDEAEPPIPRYVAEVLVAEAWYDLAVVRIVTDLEGNPVESDFTASWRSLLPDGCTGRQAGHAAESTRGETATACATQRDSW